MRYTIRKFMRVNEFKSYKDVAGSAFGHGIVWVLIFVAPILAEAFARWSVHAFCAKHADLCDMYQNDGTLTDNVGHAFGVASGTGFVGFFLAFLSTSLFLYATYTEKVQALKNRPLENSLLIPKVVNRARNDNAHEINADKKRNDFAVDCRDIALNTAYNALGLLVGVLLFAFYLKWKVCNTHTRQCDVFFPHATISQLKVVDDYANQLFQLIVLVGLLVGMVPNLLVNGFRTVRAVTQCCGLFSGSSVCGEGMDAESCSPDQSNFLHD